MDKQQIKAALQAANQAPFQAQRASGCGRAYVCISDKKMARMVSKACEELGLRFLKKAYGAGDNAIYIGYDNADGKALGKAEAFAASLNASGLPCYPDAASD